MEQKKINGLSLESFATEIAAKNPFVKASFGGFAGSGKTRTAAEFIAGVYKDMKLDAPLLIIDNEKGSRFLVKFFKDHGVRALVKDTTQLVDVLTAFKLLQSGEIGFLFIDSLSKVWYQYVRDYKTVNKKTFMTLQDWGKILPSWQEHFADAYVDLDGNCVFTGRGGFTYDLEETENEEGKKKKEFHKSGVKMKIAGETPFEPDINVWMSVEQEMKKGKPVIWREAQIMKDRSGLIDGKTFKNPKYADFQVVVKYLLSIPTGDVAQSSTSTNMAPVENFDNMRKREEREILMSEVSGLFDLHGLGGSLSKDAKQFKAAVIQKIFNTTAPERIAKMTVDEITKGKIVLEALLNDLKDNNLPGTDKMEWLKTISLDKYELRAEDLVCDL